MPEEDWVWILLLFGLGAAVAKPVVKPEEEKPPEAKKWWVYERDGVYEYIWGTEEWVISSGFKPIASFDTKEDAIAFIARLTPIKAATKEEVEAWIASFYERTGRKPTLDELIMQFPRNTPEWLDEILIAWKPPEEVKPETAPTAPTPPLPGQLVPISDGIWEMYKRWNEEARQYAKSLGLGVLEIFYYMGEYRYDSVIEGRGGLKYIDSSDVDAFFDWLNTNKYSTKADPDHINIYPREQFDYWVRVGAMTAEVLWGKLYDEYMEMRFAY
ncbi:MAG: hypothetical protein QW618_03190 [Nitrososphaerales archaeon]